MNIYFAPLEGITGYIFRNAFNEIYGHIDKYFAPFISPSEKCPLTPREMKDLTPENNHGINLIPQILTCRAEHFIEAAIELKKIGYNEINLNLGCPSGTVCAKGKGAGFLPQTTGLQKFLDDIYAYSDDGSKYRSEGYHINLRKETSLEMLAIREDINEDTKRTRFIYKILPYVIILLIAIFISLFAFIMIPARRQEDRRGKIKAQLDKENYPIPGVGPFPKLKKKEKRDIIEPEEKQIVPLGEFLSKTTETNEELKNKELEVDEDMFDHNPTRNQDIGLTNINPLAFDDGEEEVLDDGTSDELEKL